MSRDAKVIQRGVNVQDNDLAVAPGTLQHAVNVDFYRNGVASKRAGFESMYNGLPQYEIDASYNPSDGYASPVQRNTWELFSRDRLLTNTQGMIFAYDESQDYWFSVPVNLPHRFVFFGTQDTVAYQSYVGYGKAVGMWRNTGTFPLGPFSLQNTVENTNSRFVGCIANTTAEAKAIGSGSTARFIQPADVLRTVFAGSLVSDNTTIRDSAGSVYAGSITASGSTDGTGTAARFSGASWMATDNTATVWVADNTNQIRKIVSGAVVTTLAGSITAGDTDGVGTAARFRNISGLAYLSGFLYVTEGAAAHRIRKVDVTTGSVTIFAGSLAPASGYLDATGTAARFNTPTGIEVVGSTFYIGDSGNNRIRTMSTAAVVGTLNNAAGTAPTDGLVGGLASTALTPGVVVRGLHTSPSVTSSAGYAQGTYLSIECVPLLTAATLDLGLVGVTPGALASAQHVYHYARCPSTYANGVNGPNKLDSFGPNAYSQADTRAVDVGGGIAMTTCEQPRAIDIWTKLATTDTMPRLRGMGIRPPEAPAVTTSTAVGTAFANNTAWAYRYILGLKLPDGRITTSAPSERVILTNTTGAIRNGSVTCYPSPGLPYDGMPFVQLYRTKTVASTLDPGDQMFLCYEVALTYGAGAVIEDLLPDANLGPELYTNQTADGLAYASLPPPAFATEICSFQQQMVLGNYNPQASVRVKVLGTTPLVSGTSNVVFTQGPTQGFSTVFLGAVLTLVATTAATSPGSNLFQIGTGGTAAQNAAQTARNIVSCINRSPDAYFFQAFYDENDPGAFTVVSLYPGASKGQVTTRSGGKTLTQSSVTFSTNASTAFFTIAANISTRSQNAAIYSDVKIPDSMPVIYGIEIGPNTEAIQRMLPISDRMLAVKDDSVMSVDQSFGVQIYDTALSCSFPNSFAKLNNQWIGLFTRGFCSLNGSQAVAIGRAIDRDVTSQVSGSVTAPYTFTSAAAIDVYGNYACTVGDRTFVYNTLAQAWSEWQINSMVRQSIASQTEIPLVPGAGIARVSGMQGISAFRDSFVTNRDTARAMFRQRDWRRGTPIVLPLLGVRPFWVMNFSDAKYTFEGVLAADLQTITVAAYSAAENPGVLPPNTWQIPSGSGSVSVGAAFMTSQFPWALIVEDGAAITLGSVVATNETDATSAITIVCNAAIGVAAGSVTVEAFAPTLNRLQYAPSVRPGENSQFGDVLVTLERSQPGPFGVRFFNRRDLGLGFYTGVGAFSDDYGVARVATMLSNGRPVFGGTSSVYVGYDDEQRIPTPSERATDQQVAIEIWEGAAWQPLAIKAVTVEVRELGTGKPKQ